MRGNTRNKWMNYSSNQDHPHMRGEYTEPPGRSASGQGSPPHAWGILRLARPLKTLTRITPTCVGNTSSNAPHSLEHEDHPHMRGEYAKLVRLNRMPTGSPPHAWGIRKILSFPLHIYRITPTCVGNTCFKQ